MNRRKGWTVVGILALAVVIVPGCAALKSSLPKTEDIGKKRRELNSQTVSEMESRRNQAEFEAARTSWAQGNAGDCCRRLKAVLARNPDHVEARLLLTDVLLNERRPREALEVLEPAVTTHPNDARVQYGMALLLDANGQRGKAEAHYEEAVKLAPDNEFYQVSYQEAIAAGAVHTAEAIAPVPGTGAGAPVRFIDSGDGVRNSETAESVELAEPADAAVPPAMATTADLLEQGTTALAEGNSPVAVAFFERAVSDKPNDPQIPIAAAVAALRWNHPGVAVKVLEAARERFPRSAVIPRILGAAYYRQGDYASSQVALHQALSLDKSNALSYFLMGCTQAKLGQAEAAEQNFRQAQLLDPKYGVRR